MTERNSRTPTEEQAPRDQLGESPPRRAEEPASGRREKTPADSRNRERVFRFVGLGTELSGFTLVFAGIGHLIDRSGDYSKPYATALGALIGFSLGMIRFIWQVQQSNDK